jgi:hypothetical protein
MSATTTQAPREVDTALAELFTEYAAKGDRLSSHASSVLRLAGARYYYRGRQRVTDMRLEDAEPKVRAEVARMEAHRIENDGQDGLWVGWTGLFKPYDQSNAERALTGLDETRAELAHLEAAIEELEERYTGWSRFFLVTSSAGHVHSSRCCSTCRPTTTYGWLPELSGKTEAEAVADLGPTLCSVCFPSAPVEYVGGKITKAQAAKRAHS